MGMIRRVSSGGRIVFAGGVANNPCLRALLADALRADIDVPEHPEFVGAFGAALLAREA